MSLRSRQRWLLIGLPVLLLFGRGVTSLVAARHGRDVHPDRAAAVHRPGGPEHGRRARTPRGSGASGWAACHGIIGVDLAGEIVLWWSGLARLRRDGAVGDSARSSSPRRTCARPTLTGRDDDDRSDHRGRLPGPAPRPPIDAPDLELLRAFEPVVRYTNGEAFLPMSVATYLARRRTCGATASGSTRPWARGDALGCNARRRGD